MRLRRLDGIRAVAILLVILLHQGYISFGWAGVDLFFVLSGFLITQILRQRRVADNYWSRFYLRRAARILPPVLLLVALFCVSTKHIHWPMVMGYTFFAGNIVNATGHGNSMLAPLWSLAVEEHFYLLWPFLVLAFNKRGLVILLIGILLIEPILRLLFLSPDSPLVELTPLHLDGIAAGSLLALAIESNVTFPWAGWASLLLAGVFFAVPHSPRDVASPLLVSLVAAIGFCFIAWVLSLDKGVAYNLLSSTPMSYIGRISYGMYLFNMPVISLMLRVAHAHEAYDLLLIRKMLLLDCAVLVSVASLSYYLIEQPFIRFAKMRSEMVVEGNEYWWRTE